jgi:hypothetical protein
MSSARALEPLPWAFSGQGHGEKDLYLVEAHRPGPTPSQLSCTAGPGAASTCHTSHLTQDASTC